MTRKTKELVLMEAALDYADQIREASTCHRAQYSCVLTDPELRILSYGYNGVARGLPNGCIRPDEPGNCGCIHAEINAIADLRRTGYSGPLIAFITGHPCDNCAMTLLNVNTRMVVYRRPAHRTYGGTSLLDSAAIVHGSPDAMASVLRHQRHHWRQ